MEKNKPKVSLTGDRDQDIPDDKILRRLQRLSNKQLIDLLAATDSGDTSDLDEWIERSQCKRVSIMHQNSQHRKRF